MRRIRRLLVSVGWVVLAAWMLGPLVPDAGLRVHSHPEGDAAHVHLDELIAEAIGTRRHAHSHDHAHRHPDGVWGAHHPRAHHRDEAPDRRAAKPTPAAERTGVEGPSSEHAHASNPFLLFVLAVLAVLLRVFRTLAAPVAALAPFREAAQARPRARAPPLLPARLHRAI